MIIENKVSKYLLYAIGEIVLVVIGILIALGINTQQQEIAQQNKIDAILVKIQNNLLQDIDKAEWLLENKMIKDSIYDAFMTTDLSISAIKSLPRYGVGSIDFATTWYMDYNLYDGGYSQLMSIIDVLPAKYDELIKILDWNYTNRQGIFESFNANSEDIVRQYKYYLNDNHSWVAIDGYNDEMSDAQAAYILNNPRFINQISALRQSLGVMVWEYVRYRKQIMETYIMINELLGENARSMPKDIRTSSLATEKEADRFIGRYKLILGKESIFGSEYIDIVNEGKELYFKISDSEEPGLLVFLDAEKPLFGQRGRSVIWSFEHNPNKNLKIFHGGKGVTEWIKLN